ncbi:hypothetical protein BGX31_001455 [Mortierella sp. GBA43]|nr:hypothetical protein BGX31_001455 [Mortierella sp. GBA43]
MAAPSTRTFHHQHRLSQLSTSTVDDDSLSDYHRSGFDSPLSQSPVEDKEFIIHRVDEEMEDMPECMLNPSLDDISNPPFRHVEQLDVKQIDDLYPSSAAPSSESSLFGYDREHLDDPRALVARSISDEEKKSTMSKLLTRAASNGDVDRISEILKNFRDWVDINAHDDDGSTPLIHASCFGQTSAVSMLLHAGASVDERDSFGWTALVWATNNKHEHIVRLLLNHGASPKAQTTKGRTVEDFLRHDPNDTAKIAKIFKEPTKRTVRPSVQASIASKLQDYRQAEPGLMTEDGRQYQTNTNIVEELDADMTDDDKSVSDQSEAEDECEFDWEGCKIDQMLVFSSSDIPHLVKAIITTMEPTRSKPYRPVPAYVLFLAARFAINYATPDLVYELLDASLEAIHAVTKSHPDNVTLSTFWISNTSSLLHFLRKDAGLRPVSGQYEEKIEILLRDMAQMVIADAQTRMDPILEAAILEHVTIVGLKDVRYQSDWAFSFWKGIERGRKSIRRSSRLSAPPPFTPYEQVAAAAPTPKQRRLTLQVNRGKTGPSPKAVTTILSSHVKMLRAFDVPPEIIHYMVAQLLYYVGCKVFNHMIENRTYLARSYALQTRLNISVLEDWVRNNQLPARLSDQMGPLVQLLQLLQVLSQQRDLAMWIETRNKVDLLNPTQVKHVVSMYRYEVDEQRLPDEVTKYVLQVVADTEKVRRLSVSTASSRRNSRSYAGSVYSRDELPDWSETRSVRSRSGTIVSEIEQLQEDEMALACTANSAIWILFQIPANLGLRDGGIEREFVPQVPEETMTLLDNEVYSRNFLTESAGKFSEE